MNKKDREIAVFALMDITKDKGYNNLVLKKTLIRYDYLDVNKKAFITELVNGSLRNLIHIDYIIDHFSSVDINKIKPIILNILRISVYQIKFMDKVPNSAICNEAVNIAKSKGFKNLAGFVNGILRNIIRNIDNVKYPDKEKDNINYMSIFYSYPKWLLEYWSLFLDKDIIENLCIENNKVPKIAICTNILKTNTDDLFKNLIENNIDVEEGLYNKESLYIKKTSNIENINSFKEGLFHVMDESSILSVKALGLKPHNIFYDVCSAPGGKSFYASYVMENESIIKSSDIYEHKLNLISEKAKTLGIKNINVLKEDATKIYENKIDSADCVLVDAPCSGFGILRKKPDIKYNKTMDDIYALSKLQRDILSVSRLYVKVGGVLVYSTCTISEEENIKNINWFINNFNYELEDLTPFLGDNIKDEFNTLKKGFIQILPNINYIDGFFIARMIRKG